MVKIHGCAATVKARGPIVVLASSKGYMLLEQNFSADYAGYLALQNEVYTPLGIRSPNVKGFDPITSLYGYRKRSERERPAFLKMVYEDLEKSLRERHHAPKSVTWFKPNEDGHLVHEALPDEPWDVAFQRGLDHLRREGSTELVREEREFKAWQSIKAELMNRNTPLGEKRMVYSRPGQAVDTPYVDNYVDIYEAAVHPDTGERTIVLKRFASGMDEDQCEQAALKRDPHYFDDRDTPTVDAHYLGKPLKIAADGRSCEQIFQEECVLSDKAIHDDKMAEILRESIPFRLEFLKQLSMEPEHFNPARFIRSFKAVFNVSDWTKEGTLEAKMQEMFGQRYSVDVSQMSERFGSAPMALIVAGCGGISGLDILGNPSNGLNTLGNSVTQFGVSKDHLGPLKFPCGNAGCLKGGTRRYGQLETICTGCRQPIKRCGPQSDEKAAA